MRRPSRKAIKEGEHLRGVVSVADRSEEEGGWAVVGFVANGALTGSPPRVWARRALCSIVEGG